MKTSIQTKLLLMCILLVLLTTASTSVTYYLLTKQNTHRESQQRIQIAFDIILNDFTDRMNSYTTKCDEFLKRDATLALIPSLYSQDESQINSATFITSFLVRLASKTKEFGQLVSANRVAVYATNKRLLAFYQRDANQEIVGGYVISQTGHDTYFALDDPARVSTWLVVDQKPIPDEPLPPGTTPLYEGDVPENISTSLFNEGQQLGLRIVAPLYQDKSKTGVLVCDIGYTQNMLERYASLSQTDVNLFAGNALNVGTLPAQKQIESGTLEKIIGCQEILGRSGSLAVFPVTFTNQGYYQGQCALKNAQVPVGAITVSLSQNIEKEEIKKILTSVLTISGIVSVIAFGLSLAFSRRTIQAIQNIVSVIVATADGDLRKTANVTTRDEFRMLALKLNQMITQLRTISGQVQKASYAVNSTADTILQEMDALIHNMEQQSTSVDNTTMSIEKIKQFIDTVARNTNDLLSAAEQILSAIQETHASIEEVTNSTGSLTTNLHLISASIEQVNQAVKQIAGHTRHLEEVAQHTGAEIHHIDQSLTEVSRNADHAQQLAKETMYAATSGEASVEASMQGMAELKEVVANTAQIIRKVNIWGERVSSILDIVDEITEQTALLSLNASIISAQAGVHGRGFAVVADEIKELATRTKASTKEIGTLIHELQKNTEEGVNNTVEGLKKADQGMQLASAVKAALATILGSATRSSDRAADTAQLIQQTVTSGRIISTQMNSVTEMVSKIRVAIQEQEQDVEQVVAAVENISGMSEQVNRSSVEQKKVAEEIARSMEDVTAQFSDLSKQTETLQQSSDQIVTAMHTIGSTTEQILQNAVNISGDTVKDLVEQSDVLQKIVTVFKVS